MGSGRCTVVVTFGTLEVPCPYSRGIFGIQLSALGDLNAGCQVCSHPISQHEDVSSAPAQDSSQSKLPTINFLTMASE
jgi:hypothetical protein